MIHLEVLVEDTSGKIMLDKLLPMIFEDIATVTYAVHSYKGVGRVPKNLQPNGKSPGRMLLDSLPKLLDGYGKTFSHWPLNTAGAVVLVCDLDDKPLVSFKKQLEGILEACSTQPETRFCFAIEEGEAWLLGDIPAIEAAYPKVQKSILRHYKNDTICGTWEVLAEALSFKYKNAAWYACGQKKAEWAEQITPYMNIESNESPSFQYFVKTVRDLAKPR